MGESTSDYSVHAIDPVIAVVLGFCGFVAALALQFSVRRYIAWTYWLAVVGVGVFGTMAADVLHVRFGVPYAASSALYSIVLLVVFVSWDRTEKTLSFTRSTLLAGRRSTGPRSSRRSRWAPRLEISPRQPSAWGTSPPDCCSPGSSQSPRSGTGGWAGTESSRSGSLTSPRPPLTAPTPRLRARPRERRLTRTRAGEAPKPRLAQSWHTI